MKRCATLIVPLALSFSIVAAGSQNKSVGTRTTTSIIDGKVVQKTETVAEPNPLPPADNFLEQEKSKPIPNSGAFNSSIRWQSTDAAAIGQDIAVNANGTNAFIGWNLNNLRTSFHDNNSGTPIWEHTSDPQTYRNYVSLSADANLVANTTYHNIYLFDKSSGAITFNFNVPDSRIAGPIAVSRDGHLLACACTSPLSGGTHRVYAFNPPSTTPIWTFDFSDAQSSGVYGIDISIDRSTVAVNGKFYGWILNATDGTVRTQMEIANTESRIALSADASVLAIAELSGFVKAYAYNTAQSRYDLLWLYRIPPGVSTNWASSVEVSADGLTIMAGSLVFLSAGYDGSVYMFDTFGEGVPLWVMNNLGDEVGMVGLSDDGSLGAAATWGDINNPAKPTILIFERNSNSPVYSVSSPGSMFSLAMSADGKSVVAGGKHVHARTFGSGGDAYYIGVDMGGGAIAGTVTLGGVPPNHSGTTVQVLGTNKRASTLPNGQYVVANISPGTYSVRISHLGYVGTTLSSVVVAGTDTTRNVNATLQQTGAAPTNLVASHSLSSRIQLNWTNPTLFDDRAFDRIRAVDDIKEASVPTISARNSERRGEQSLLLRSTSPQGISDLLPPDSIKIYRAIRTGGPYYHKRTLAGTQSSYVDSSAMPLKSYYYRVTAIYGNGESEYSNEAYGTVDSSFLQFAFTTPHKTTTPTIDGTLSPGEWADAIQVDVSDVFGYGGGVRLPRSSTFMYFKYDSVAKKLYIAGEDFLNNDGLAESEGFGLYFDDNHNRQFEPIGTDSLLREGNYWAYYFSAGSNVRFREIYTGGGVNAIVDVVTDAQVAFSSATGHVTGEVSIPISFFNKNHLQVFAPNRTVGAGLFMIGRNAGAAVFHGWWPQTMISVFTPNGFGDVTIPIRLLAPPKAPANIAVTRQGNRLRITWTDPTQGINNDPLTVPITLELWRNGSPWRTFPSGAQAWTDSNIVAQGWYEYKIRGSINVTSSPNTTFFGPFSPTVGTFAVSDPQLTELIYDDGQPDPPPWIVSNTYDGNMFGTRFTPQQYPAKVCRVKAFTNVSNSPIQIYIYSDSSGIPGHPIAGPWTGTTCQTAGVDSFLVTIPGTEPPTITSGDFHVVLAYLPTSPTAPGIYADVTQPLLGRSMFFTNTLNWTLMPGGVDLMVRAFITGQPSAVGDEKGLPKEFALSQNYPNPFNPATNVSYQLAARSQVSLKVFDVLGREVATLVNEEKEPGTYSAVWDARNAASGVYFYRLDAGNFTSVRKLLLLK
jgi:hypothetical protein